MFLFIAFKHTPKGTPNCWRDPSEGYTLDEAVIAQMYEHEALLKLLIEKGVITKDEHLDKVKDEIRIARAEGRERFRKG